MFQQPWETGILFNASRGPVRHSEDTRGGAGLTCTASASVFPSIATRMPSTHCHGCVLGITLQPDSGKPSESRQVVASRVFHLSLKTYCYPSPSFSLLWGGLHGPHPSRGGLHGPHKQALWFSGFSLNSANGRAPAGDRKVGRE